jgi:hypothetical protein
MELEFPLSRASSIKSVLFLPEIKLKFGEKLTLDKLEL